MVPFGTGSAGTGFEVHDFSVSAAPPKETRGASPRSFTSDPSRRCLRTQSRVELLRSRSKCRHVFLRRGVGDSAILDVWAVKRFVFP